MNIFSSHDSPAGQALLSNAKEIKARFGEESLVENLKVRFETEASAIGATPLPDVPEVGIVEQQYISAPEFGPIRTINSVGDTLDFLEEVNDAFSAIVVEELYERDGARFDLLPNQDCETRSISLVCHEDAPGITSIHSIMVEDTDFPVIFMLNSPNVGTVDAFEVTITPTIEEELKLVKDERLTKSYIESDKSFWAEEKSKIAVYILAVIENS